MSLLCYGLGQESTSCIKLRMCMRKISMADRIIMKKTSVRVGFEKVKIKVKVCADG